MASRPLPPLTMWLSFSLPHPHDISGHSVNINDHLLNASFVEVITEQGFYHISHGGAVPGGVNLKLRVE